MQVHEIVEELSRVLSLEMDAVQAYAAAVPLATPGPVHDELALFALEHQLHAIELHRAILSLGHGAPSVTPDVKGYVIGAITPPRRRPSPEELLEAMRGNEQLTNAVLAKALAKPLPQETKELLARFRADEQHHLEWVERTLSRRPWEGWSAAHP